ncbi:MAG: hypothetical protein HY817_01015 [Candidatus Abawacabacteria bacterium]|nr:hypothetical protein [Candidatus Abawacabacteria bacterium]
MPTTYLLSALLPNYPAGSGLLSSQTVEAVGVFYLNIILSFLGLVALVIMILGGVKMLTAAGNGEQFKSGRTILIGAAVGFVIIILAFAIVATLIGTFGTPWVGGVAPGRSGVGIGVGISL